MRLDEPQTILVVDDEPPIRALIGTALKKRGYSVLEARSGQEALALFQRHVSSISLLLTDIRMPEMTGPQLVEKLLCLKPDVSVMFVTAFSMDRPADMRVFRCLDKPFAIATLTAAVEKLVAPHKPGAGATKLSDGRAATQHPQ
jgi:two-component system cell cycle sensor histidine kinase/response regulator CckA